VIPSQSGMADQIIKKALQNGQRALDEYQAKQILAVYGLPVTQEKLALTEEETVQAAKTIGYPVAVKACSWEIMHKTGKGLIALNVGTDAKVRRAWRAIRKAAGADVPVLIQEMLPGNREFVAGMTRFPGFGCCVLFGLGGIFTEALKDTTFRSAPLSTTEAEEMILDIRAKQLTGEFRGMPAVDKGALANVLQGIGFIALLHPEISEIDLNPVIITGSRPVIADALFVL
jgi:acetyltransferase